MNTPQLIQSRPIAPGTFACTELPPTYACRHYTIIGPIERHSDQDLLTYCEYTPEFGGRVERMPGIAHVIVHTD